MRFRLIPRDRSFYPLFRRAAANLVDAAHRLDAEMGDFEDLALKHKGIVECESLGDDITRQLIRKLNSTYVTPFDREDILTLAQAMDDVLDDIQAASDLLVLHNIVEPLPEMRELSGIMVRAAEETVPLIDKLEALKGVDPHLEKIDALESEADAAYRRTVARLFSGDYKPRDILRWKDVVEALERAVNDIEDIANIVESIVLKHA